MKLGLIRQQVVASMESWLHGESVKPTESEVVFRALEMFGDETPDASEERYREAFLYLVECTKPTFVESGETLCNVTDKTAPTFEMIGMPNVETEATSVQALRETETRV